MYRFPHDFTLRVFKLNELYIIKGNLYRFVRATKTGHNFISVKTGKGLFKRLLYVNRKQPNTFLIPIEFSNNIWHIQ